MTESLIAYDLEHELTVPAGMPVTVLLEVTIEPPDAGALIYCYASKTSLQPIEVRGSGKHELTVVNPRIWIKYLYGLKTFRLREVGYRDKPQWRGP